jgi:hypothetical protein
MIYQTHDLSHIYVHQHSTQLNQLLFLSALLTTLSQKESCIGPAQDSGQTAAAMCYQKPFNQKQSTVNQNKTMKPLVLLYLSKYLDISCNALSPANTNLEH